MSSMMAILGQEAMGQFVEVDCGGLVGLAIFGYRTSGADILSLHSMTRKIIVLNPAEWQQITGDKRFSGPSGPSPRHPGMFMTTTAGSRKK
jgi:hypothetical protein